MEFRIEVTALPADAGWQVQIFDVAAGALLADPANGAALAPRTLARKTVLRRGLEFGLPLPPADEVERLPADAPHLELCTNPEKTLDAFEQIVERRTPDTKRFGRYLFDTLIGSTAWAAMLTKAAPNQPIELSLAWPAEDAIFNRLPWEMMHTAGNFFVAQEARVAIVRRCPKTPQSIDAVSTPPKVLFVVGTDLQKDVIQPGAEYLRLLQGLRDTDLDVSLRTRLLLRANVNSLAAAMKEFQPDVVHFICHGAYDQKRVSYLQLVDPENDARAAPVYPAALVSALGSPLPSIVVLSACHTADQDLRPVGQVSAPFAAALVAAGIPVAVGMAGRVMDQACRLFTRRFYEALLSNGDIAHAAAEGRRAAIRGGQTNPEQSVDWTMPTIFFAEGVRGTRVPIAPRETDQLWHAVSREFAPGSFPAFCDRLEIVERFDLLLADERTQKVTLRSGDLQALFVSCLCADGPQKYGRTWLLKELAAQAMRSGHVAVLVEKKEVDPTGDWPRTSRALLQWVPIAVDNTVARFATHLVQVAGPHCQNLRLLGATAQGAALPADVAARLGGSDPDHPRVQAAALRLDLLAFLKAVRELRPETERAGTRLVLLFDDVHNTSPEVVAALETWFGAVGLRQARMDLRTVLMFSSEASDGQHDTIARLTPLANNSWTHRIDLDRFRPPTDREAYQFFLLNFRNRGGEAMPLVAVKENNVAEALFLEFDYSVQGVPSNLEGTREFVERIVRFSTNSQVRTIEVARDDALLKAALAFEREATV
jgi:hypothetical protein